MQPASAVAALAALLVLADLSAQAATATGKAPPDPYTAGEPAALQKAGYVSLGPFSFGTGHTTQAVEALLGDEPIAWIETAHFRIGCSLSAMPLKADEPWSGDWVEGVRRELKRLATRIPRVKVNTRELDPWLRAHLVAQRAEDVYAEVMAVLGVTDDAFPAAPGDDPHQATQFRGLGPYLGMRDKYRLLIVKRSASHARYTRAYYHREMGDQIRDHDVSGGFLYWGGSEEAANGLLRNDLALHAHLAFNVAHNMYSGYRSFGHDLPAWLSTGLGHWHSRRITPRFPVHDRRNDKDKDLRSGFWEWEQRVTGLMKNSAFEPLETFLERRNPGDFRIEQHMQAWSLVDFLMSQKKDQIGGFLRLMKAPFHARMRLPTDQDMRVRQQDAIASAFAIDVPDLTAEWRNYVLKGSRRTVGRR